MARRMLAPWLFALTSAQVDPPAAQTASPSAPSRVQPLVVTAARPKAQVLIDRTVDAVGGDHGAGRGSVLAAGVADLDGVGAGGQRR